MNGFFVKEGMEKGIIVVVGCGDHIPKGYPHSKGIPRLSKHSDKVCKE
jgi:hypothetical protein